MFQHEASTELKLKLAQEEEVWAIERCSPALRGGKYLMTVLSIIHIQNQAWSPKSETGKMQIQISEWK